MFNYSSDNKTTSNKIFHLLSSSERRDALLLFVLITVGMLFEMLGVGLIIPAVTLIMQDDLVSRYPVTAPFISFMGNPSQSELITIVMFGFVAIYLVKNIYIAFLIWRQTKFTFDMQANLAKRLFTTYLQQPYMFHLQRNSAELVRNITGEVGIFTGMISSSLLLITELMVLIGIGTLLLFVEPMGALIVVLVLGIAAWGFHRLSRDRILNWGVERQHHDGLSLQHLQQGIGGVKDVKLLGREDDFILQFHSHNMQSANAWKKSAILQNLPRLIFELLAVMGLAILVLVMLNQGDNLTSIVPTLGLFAVAAFRLMPSVNRVLTSLQTLRYSLPVVNTLYEEIMLNTSESMSFQYSGRVDKFKNDLSLLNVTYYYPDTSKPALNSVSIKIHKGESIGLIGSSGSGKSTLVDVILGLLNPSDGSVEVDSNNILGGLRHWQDQIGYVPQSIYLTDDTLERNVAFGLPKDQIDNLSVLRALKAAQLDVFVAGLPDGLETIVGERGVRLSGGQRQRIGIARALYHDPAVLVLDEATSALDGKTEQGVMEAINALHGSKTIIVVAHRLSTVEKCDRLYRLADGKVVEEGLPKDMLYSEA